MKIIVTTLIKILVKKNFNRLIQPKIRKIKIHNSRIIRPILTKNIFFVDFDGKIIQNMKIIRIFKILKTPRAPKISFMVEAKPAKKKCYCCCRVADAGATNLKPRCL